MNKYIQLLSEHGYLDKEAGVADYLKSLKSATNKAPASGILNRTKAIVAKDREALVESAINKIYKGGHDISNDRLLGSLARRMGTGL